MLLQLFCFAFSVAAIAIGFATIDESSSSFSSLFSSSSSLSVYVASAL
jgi:hypothetical protein